MSDTTVERDLDNITEDEAFNLVYQLEKKFGWAMVLFCRGDVESYIRGFSESEHILTDEEWETVRHSWTWRKFGDWAPHSAELFEQILDDPDIRNVLVNYEED